MRRIGADIGAGAASLYRYLDDKEDLYDLMADAVLGEAAIPDRPSGDWRSALTAAAVARRAAIHAHPWLPQISTGRVRLGPNQLRLTEFLFAALDGHRLSIDDALAAVGTVISFVDGHVTNELAEHEARRRSGLDHAQWQRRWGPYLSTLIASGEYPMLERIVVDAEIPHDPERDERTFTFGLQLLLDGLAAAMAQRSRRSS